MRNLPSAFSPINPMLARLNRSAFKTAGLLLESSMTRNEVEAKERYRKACTRPLRQSDSFISKAILRSWGLFLRLVAGANAARRSECRKALEPPFAETRASHPELLATGAAVDV